MLAAVGGGDRAGAAPRGPWPSSRRGAQELAEGHFDRRLNIRSGDELQILAEAFNHMTSAAQGERRRARGVEQEAGRRQRGAEGAGPDEVGPASANVSHELRTPLTAIKGYTDYILERKLGAITDKQEKGLVGGAAQPGTALASRSARCSTSRAWTSGRIALNLQPFAWRSLVEQIHTTVRSELDKKRLRFRA